MEKLVKLLMVICLLVTGSVATAGTYSLSTAAPTTDIVAQDGEVRTTYTKIFDLDANDNHGRGNSFRTAVNPYGDGWNVASLTIRKYINQTFDGDVLKVWIVEGTADMWALGDGDGDGDLLDGTGMTATTVNGESFTLNGLIANNNYVMLTFDSSVYLKEDTVYCWFAMYEQAGGPNYFQLVQTAANQAEPDSNQIQIKSAVNTKVASANPLTHYLQGERTIAANPVPEDGEVQVLVDTNLAWDNPVAYDAEYFEVYIRPAVEAAEPNWLGADTVVFTASDLDLDGDPLTTETAIPFDLDPTTQHYWKVFSYEPNLLGDDAFPHGSETWTFTTASLDPEFTADPAGMTVAAGASALFSFEAINYASTTWYYSDDVVVGGDTTVGTGDTLELTNVQESDEGWYYAVISKAGYPDATSQMAQLMTQRLVAYWDFEDGSLTDSKEGFVGQIDDPNFAAGAGLDGSTAYELFNDARFIEIADSADFFNFFPQGLTVNVWVKTPTATLVPHAWMSPVSKVVGNTQGFAFFTTRGDRRYSGPFLNTGAIASGTSQYHDAEWHMATMTYDPALASMVYYVDGEYVTSNSPSVPDIADTPLVFGMSNYPSANPYVGLIDEIKIFTYDVGALGVLGLYNEYSPEQVIRCVIPYASGLDVANAETGLTSEDEGFEPDCVVNMADFAALAEGWMTDGRTMGTIAQ